MLTPLAQVGITTPRKRTTAPLPRHILVGYWHNWQTEAANFIRLKNVSPKFDVINVAFATASPIHGQIVFTPCAATTHAEFKADIAYLQRRGKKVLLSVGGANGSTAIDNAQAQRRFVDSLKALVYQYGFDGVDINLEGHVTLESGDADFKTPTSPSIKYLVAALRQLRSHFDANFILSMAPETVCVQGGYRVYGGRSGAYLPIIDGLRDLLTYVHIQHYNSDAMLAFDGNVYAQGTADFHVAMTEMLLQGFPVGGDPCNVFPALRPEQMAIGLPALAYAAADGYTAPQDVQRALNYLTKGRSFGGAYQLRQTAGYTALRGVMTWSINWDAANRHQFSNTTRAYLDALP